MGAAAMNVRTLTWTNGPRHKITEMEPKERPLPFDGSTDIQKQTS